jgi:hypothetical protein
LRHRRLSGGRLGGYEALVEAGGGGVGVEVELDEASLELVEGSKKAIPA